MNYLLHKTTRLFGGGLAGISGAFMPLVASAKGVSADSIFGDIIYMNALGPVIFERMLHSWVALVAAIIVFILALKYMKGGYLARPILLIGFGSLADGLLGIALPPALYASWMWIGSLILTVCIIIAVFWMEKLFRAMQS